MSTFLKSIVKHSPQAVLSKLDKNFLAYILNILKQLDKEERKEFYKPLCWVVFYYNKKYSEWKWKNKLAKSIVPNEEIKKYWLNDDIPTTLSECKDDLLSLLEKLQKVNNSYYLSVMSNYLHIDKLKLSSNLCFIDYSVGKSSDDQLSFYEFLLMDHYVYLEDTEGKFKWHKFNGCYWVKCEEESLCRDLIRSINIWAKDTNNHCSKELGKIPSDPKDQSDDDKERFHKLNKAKELADKQRKTLPITIKKNLEFFRQALQVTQKDIDNAQYAKKNFLVCSNGMVNLITGELQKFTSLWYNTQCTSVNYHPQDKTGDKELQDFFTKFTCGNDDLLSFLKKLCGYLVTGYINEQQFYILYGKLGSNGKSVFVSLLKQTLGSYYANLNPSCIIKQNKSNFAGSATSHLQGVFTTRIGTITEVNKGSLYDEDAFKRITGGDDITHRGLYERQQRSHKASTKILLAANDLPRFQYKQSMDRRLCCVPCNARFVDDTTKIDPENGIFKRDITFGDDDSFAGQSRIKEAFLRFVVQGAQEYMVLRKKGKTLKDMLPECVQEATRKYIEQCNPMLRFIKDITIQKDQTYSLKYLYDNYKLWWHERTEKQCCNLQTMTTNLEEMHYELINDENSVVIPGNPTITQPIFEMIDTSRDVNEIF